MSDNTTATIILTAEVAAGAWIADTLAHLPPGVVGAVSALCVGIVLRLFDAPLRRRSEWLDHHLSGPHPAQPPTVPAPPPVEPPDDPDPTG